MTLETRWVRRGDLGYLRFVGVPPSTHFAVAPAKRGTAEEAADAFLEEYRSLFVNVSPVVGFDVHRVNTHNSRSYALPTEVCWP